MKEVKVEDPKLCESEGERRSLSWGGGIILDVSKWGKGEGVIVSFPAGIRCGDVGTDIRKGLRSR
ncbi:hypothetical protein BCY86_02240 [Pajaroellobacter abortibovis]|uniref:Uncharacterized protein n=1 Tax=Pajaroellobacter abortibovis TaxID=1882918 RepID=A0A1L6MW25_9BACT|nr:hypothetical protein BCY86_02240 [Pajaroellobacter abortibovis]